MTTAVLELRDVTKVYGSGVTEVHALVAGRQPAQIARRRSD